jgi:radical SAM superfamily enzyme YgiQ (UPF0313 family)
MQVMGGFILGFDTDREDIFDRMVEFIQKSGIPIAMVGLLQAMPGTQLFHRLWKEGRILSEGLGDNTDDKLNFLPHMDATRLVEGYRSVLKRIYSREAYYERVKLYLSRIQPQLRERKRGERRAGQQWLTVGNARAFVTSIVRQGIFARQRWSYWKFLLTVATRHDSGGDGVSLPGNDEKNFRQRGLARGDGQLSACGNRRADAIDPQDEDQHHSGSLPAGFV